MDVENRAFKKDRKGNFVADIGRRHYLKLTGSVLTASSIGVSGCIGSSSDSYPTENVTWINPSGGSGGYGAYAQALSKFLPKSLPNDVEIPVRSIGSWPRGTSKIYRADPDGYTIGWIDVPGLVGYQIAQDPNFDLRKSSLMNRVAFHPFSIAVPQKSPYKTVKDMQDADEVTFAAPGGAVVTILSIIGTEIMNIPLKLITGYTGSAATITAVLRGDAEAVSLPPTTPPMAAALKNNDLRLIVSYGKKSPKIAPDVPTASDLGYDKLTGKGITRLVGGPPEIEDEKTNVLSESILETIKQNRGFRQWAKESDLFQPLAPLGRKGARQVLDESFNLISNYKHALEKYI